MPIRPPVKGLTRNRRHLVKTAAGKAGAHRVLLKPGEGVIVSQRFVIKALRRKQFFGVDSASLVPPLRPQLASTPPTTGQEADKQIAQLVKAHASSLDALAKL